MANKSKNNKNLIIGICSAVVVIIIVAVVAILLATRGGIGGGQALNDNYFVSDNTKYVLTMEADEIDIDEDSLYKPVKTHLIYFYNGNDITGLKYYYEFEDAETAKKAYDESLAELQSIYKEVALDGKYVIMTSNETDYEGLTAEDVKQQLEFMEMIKNLDFTDSDTSDDGLVEETVEVTE